MQSVVRIVNVKDQVREDLRYWLSRPMAERVAAVEQLRLDHEACLRGQRKEGAAAAEAEPRLQKVCRIVPLKRP